VLAVGYELLQFVFELVRLFPPKRVSNRTNLPEIYTFRNPAAPRSTGLPRGGDSFFELNFAPFRSRWGLHQIWPWRPRQALYNGGSWRHHHPHFPLYNRGRKTGIAVSGVSIERVMTVQFAAYRELETACIGVLRALWYRYCTKRFVASHITNRRDGTCARSRIDQTRSVTDEQTRVD